MLKWLKSAKEKEKEPRPGLPNPENASTPEKKDLMEKINDIVDEDYEDPNVTPNSGRKYSHYTPEQKAKIAMFAIDKSACFGNFLCI